MSLMPKKPRRKDEVKIDGELLDILTCPVCLDEFRYSFLLTRCGHTVCWNCVQNISKHSADLEFLICPVCRSKNSFNESDTFGIQRNYTIDGVIQLLRQKDPKPWKRKLLGVDCPHADVVTTSVTTCPHCTKKFCNVCCLAHIEHIKMEANWIVSDFKSRYEETHADLENKSSKMKAAIVNLVNETKAKIETESEHILNVLKELVLKRKEELIAEANNFGETQLKRCSDLLEASEPVNEFLGSFSDDLKRLNDTSPLYCDLNEVAELHAGLRKKDSYLQEYDSFGKGVLLGKLEMKNNFDEWLPIFKETFSNMLNNNFALCKLNTELWGMKPIFEFERLRQAAETGDLECIKAALERPCLSSNCIRFMVQRPILDDSFCNLLSLAVKGGHLPLVRYLVEEKGADASNFEYFWSAWCTGAKAVSDEDDANHLTVWRLLLDNEPSLLTQKTQQGSLLHMAARKGLTALARFLVEEKGVDINIPNYYDETPPIWKGASYSKVVELLICLGADLHQKGKTRETILHRIANFGTVESFNLVRQAAPDLVANMDHKSCIELTRRAACSGSQQMVETVFSLFESELSASTDPEECQTLLSAVIDHVPDPFSVFKTLGENGVLTRAFRAKGCYTLPLHSAVERNSDPDIFRELVHFLLAQDPSMLSRLDYKGRTAIDLAFKERRYSYAQFLISCGPQNEVCSAPPLDDST